MSFGRRQWESQFAETSRIKHDLFYDAETDRRALKSVALLGLRLVGATTNAGRKQTPHYNYNFIGRVDLGKIIFKASIY